MIIARPHGNIVVTHHSGVGTPIVLLHGLMLDHRLFDGLLPYLGDRPRWIPDLRGHGESSCDTDYSWQEMIQDIAAVLQIIACPVHLVGVSMGGMLAIEAALQEPGSIMSLALIGAAVDGETPETIARAQQFSAAISAQGLEALVPAITALFLGSSSENPELAQAVAGQISCVGTTNALRCIQAMLQRTDQRSRLSGIVAPTLSVWGADDAIITAVRCRDTAERIARHATTEVTGAGHLVSCEKPALLGIELVRWWARAEG